MANAFLTLADRAQVRAGQTGAGLLPPSAVELNLLLEWPQRSRPQWTGIFAGSVALHIILFLIAIQIPSVVQNEPVQRVALHHIPLYLPRDVMTQREPNRQKLSKQIDLVDLLASQQSQARRSAPRPSAKHFELPKQSPAPHLLKNPPQILPEAPAVATNQTPAPLPMGSPDGITAPPPPVPSTSPFEDVGTQAPPSAHPKLAPPKSGIQAAISGLAQNANGRHLIISDDSPSEPSVGAPGSLGHREGQHASVELQSDPQGADFKPYLMQILSIVRANWRRVIPESARMGTLRGRAVIEFIISRDGTIPKLVTSDSSGLEPLDRAAVAGLSMSNPLPPLPADFKGYQVRLAFSFAYNMPAQ